MNVLDQFRLNKKVAVVTGGGQGIGRAFVLALAEAGADVVIADINERCGGGVREEVVVRGGRALFVKTDINVEEDIRRMVGTAVDTFGGLDILVNNANAGGPNDDDWIGRNLKAVLRCSRAAVEEMKKRGRGKLINVGSISSKVVNVGGFNYCTEKAGVVMLTKCMAVEWAGYNINANCISPSYTLSPARRRDSVEKRRQIRGNTPMGWYERPEDMCGTLIYLASDASNYLTGQEISVDGGTLLGDWGFAPPRPRVAPPLISPEEEAQSLKHDLDMLGVPYDEDGVPRN